MSTSSTLLLRAYGVLSAFGAPLGARYARRRLADAPPERHEERLGRATQARPDGPLIWIHAVSVGEFLSILGVLDSLRRQAPHVALLVTTTTATSAALAQKRLPEGVIHQFSPLDTPRAVRRFLDHWRPDLAVYTESELWPNQLKSLRKRGIPTILMNARLSEKSRQSWKRFAKTAGLLLDHFTLILCQSETIRKNILALAPAPQRVVHSGDLKASSDPLPVDDTALEQLRLEVGQRPVWVASSTHMGEEEPVLAAHRAVLREIPEALLILVPRHPERADEVRELAVGFALAQRSNGDAILAETQVYMADTLGETGLWYRLAPVVFVAGSFAPVGGHNPYEPAHFGAAILHGPLYANFAQAYADMAAAGAAVEVADGDALGDTVVRMLREGDGGLGARARTFARSAANIRDDVAKRLLGFLGPATKR